MDPITVALGAIHAYDLLRTTATKVREDAPKVAEAVQGLWRKMSGKKPDESTPPPSGMAADMAAEAVAKEDVTAKTKSHNVSLGELQSQFHATLEILNTLAEQSEHFAEFVEAARQNFEETEKQIARLTHRAESDSALIKGLESYNLRLAKEVELQRLHLRRMNGVGIAIGLIAIAGFAMALSLLIW